MKIYDILDVEKLNEYIHEGYISRRTHPHLTLAVLNYTAKAQYEPLWDDVTLQCRGLIVDDHANVVASCMKKFFNYGEIHAPKDLTGPVQVTDKLDGSLGSVSFYEGELVVATRGSFESDQAKFAYELIKNKEEYYSAFKIICDDNVTAVVEIIYPENRIVVNYGDMRDVVLIGAIGNNYELQCQKQLWIPAENIYSWPGPIVQKFSARSFDEALKIPARANAEGIVVYFEKSGERLKIKQDDYIALHKFVSNLSPKTTWENLSSGKTIEDILSITPDEFHAEVRDWAERIILHYEDVIMKVEADYEELMWSLPDSYTRKDFAMAVKGNKYQSLLFMLLDQQTDRMLVSAWKLVQP